MARLSQSWTDRLKGTSNTDSGMLVGAAMSSETRRREAPSAEFFPSDVATFCPGDGATVESRASKGGSVGREGTIQSGSRPSSPDGCKASKLVGRQVVVGLRGQSRTPVSFKAKHHVRESSRQMWREPSSMRLGWVAPGWWCGNRRCPSPVRWPPAWVWRSKLVHDLSNSSPRPGE